MNVVDFAEGILGIGESRYEVANCLRQSSTNYDEGTALLMKSVAINLDLGSRIDIEDIRLIGEKALADTQRLFLDAKA